MDITQNNLGEETSPYLLQHQDNPVHWQPWGPAALSAAKESGKPILLSVGYAACHWCHVMAHESFENPEIATVMNDLFINIKVDREERPDIDVIYQQALALMGQQGGWPLTMFMTPDGEPFWGGTYFPDRPAYGRPGFTDILNRVSQVYHEDSATVLKNKDAILDALSKLSAPNTDNESIDLTSDLFDQVAFHLLKSVDMTYGGIGEAPKFPHTTALWTIWRGYLRSGDESLAEAVLLSLRQMCQGGIYDHLGGGFARYSTDEKWLAPHFEKMLYDNALLIDILTSVWAETGDNLFKARIYETIDWVFREMVAEGGAFASSLDADSEGVEGKFYVWQEGEIARLLGSEANLFMHHYNVTSNGNWEGTTILNRSRELSLTAETTEEKLAQSREVLFTARAERIRPGWDDKILADWNGLMIAALAQAGAAFNEPTWVDAAARAYAFIMDNMAQGDRLLHAYRAGKAQHMAMLDDHCHLAYAALKLYQVTEDQGYLTSSEHHIAVMDKFFWDDTNGGYFFTAHDAEDLIARQRTANDQAVPAGNGIAGEVLTRLWYLTGDIRYRERVDELFAAFSPEVRTNFFPLTTLLNSADLYLNALQVCIVGAKDDPDTEKLRQTVHLDGNPNIVLQRINEGAPLPALHPAQGKTTKNGKPTAYVCIGSTCSLPITDAEALASALKNPDI